MSIFEMASSRLGLDQIGLRLAERGTICMRDSQSRGIKSELITISMALSLNPGAAGRIANPREPERGCLDRNLAERRDHPRLLRRADYKTAIKMRCFA